MGSRIFYRYVACVFLVASDTQVVKSQAKCDAYGFLWALQINIKPYDFNILLNFIYNNCTCCKYGHARLSTLWLGE